MTDELEPEESPETEEAAPSAASKRVVIVLVVVAILAGLLAARVMVPRSQTGAANSAAGSLTSTRIDAVAAYQSASRTGRPIYVLFHSLT